MSLLKDSSAMDPTSASAASTSLGQVPSAGASPRGRQGWHRAPAPPQLCAGCRADDAHAGHGRHLLSVDALVALRGGLGRQIAAPSAAHWLGTDAFGRDILSLLMVGARNSILVGVIAVGIGMGVGTALGLLAAARKGWVEEAIMRLADFTFAFPALLLAIMLTAVFGAGIVNSIIAIGIFYIPTFARVTRASANAVWAREYILAARACGKGTLAHHAGACAAQHPLGADRAGHHPVCAGHPGRSGAVVPGAGHAAARALVGPYAERGADPHVPGPLLAVWPGVAIALAVLGLNLLGDGLRDLLDPAWREKMTPLSRFAPSPLSTRCALWGDAASARKPYAACAGWRPARPPRNTPRQFHAQ